MISIIIPVYKAEKFLRRCADSILAQGFQDWECILVDDGSPDNSGAICDEYAAKDPRFCVIHKPNGGVSTARNCGLEVAKGDWITFVDSDDFVDALWLDSLAKAMMQPADTYMWGHFLNRNANNEFKAYLPSGKTYCSAYSFLTSPDYKHLSVCFLYKASIIREYGCCFPMGIKSGEDQCFIMEYLSHVHSVITIPEAFYYYDDNPDSAVNTRLSLEDTADALKVAVVYAEYAKLHKDIDSLFIKKCVEHLFYIFLFLAYDRGHALKPETQKIYKNYFDKLKSIIPNFDFDNKLKLTYYFLPAYAIYMKLSKLKRRI